ncbi:T9SS type A sorting domain-containing protein [Flavobacterium sp.]|uniref:T9SS type A sorting domain-containing protein n=1 Tax=Flavobacterium sp. TaxID=239 RepID=UPI0031DDEE69
MKTKLLVFFLIFTTFKIAAQQQIYSLKYLNDLNLIEYNDNIVFLGGEEETGIEIWKSEGTTETTSLVKDVYSGKESGVQDLRRYTTILNGTLYFIGKDETSAGEIWKTDGTANGTVKVTNFLNGRVWKITAAGDSIYFLIKKEDYVLQVWKTDGTSEGTVIVKDNIPIWNDPTFEGKCGNIFIFTFQPYFSNGSKVWRSDGTADGTFPLTEEKTGNGSGVGGTSALSQYLEEDSKLYFVSRSYLHETDGTISNTKALSSYSGPLSVQYSDVIKVGNSLYYLFFSGDNFSIEIWKYDLVNKQTTSVYSANSQKYFFPSGLVKTDDSLLFCGPNNTGGTSLLSLNLSNNAVSDIKELTTAAFTPFIFNQSFNIATIIKINSNDYFITSAVDQFYQRKGWIYNKSQQTTENITALDNVWHGIVYKDYLYYGKNNILWKYANNLNTISNNKEPFLTFYPNPANDFVQINTNNNDEIENVRIYDLNGKLVNEISNYKNNKIDVSRLSKGIYNMQVKLNGIYINKKVIKN